MLPFYFDGDIQVERLKLLNILHYTKDSKKKEIMWIAMCTNDIFPELAQLHTTREESQN